MQRPVPQQGFVLVSGLVLLSLITLLALGSMNTATFEERMGSNYRERSQAVDAAEATLRDGESIIRQQLTLPVAALDPADPFWPAGLPVGGNPQNLSAFLASATWAGNRTTNLRSRAYGQDSGASALPHRSGADGELPAPRYFIEDYDFRCDSLDPSACAQNIGANMYRVTGHAVGGNDSTTVILQSLYRKRFN